MESGILGPDDSKEVLSKLSREEGEDLLYQDIRALKRKGKCLEYFSKCSPRGQEYVYYYFTVCPNMTNLNEISGVIPSPFYPRHYPTNQSCSWEIRARKGKRILFTIQDIDFSLWCSGVWLEWYD